RTWEYEEQMRHGQVEKTRTERKACEALMVYRTCWRRGARSRRTKLKDGYPLFRSDRDAGEPGVEPARAAPF
ncbi:hypothetical protein B0H17DRAFT_926868, partial [Mycena rosella]